jgi:D-threo-aldose 1-dehydrogenase
VCARHGVALAAAALQFPLGHPAVASVVTGMRSVAEVEANLAHCARRSRARSGTSSSTSG